MCASTTWRAVVRGRWPHNTRVVARNVNQPYSRAGAGSRVKRVPESSLAEILVLAGGAILLVPAVPASASISARLKYIGESGRP